MPPVGFEPTISAGARPQTYALHRAATGTGKLIEMYECINRNQRDATITVLLTSKISSTCFGQTFAHLQKRKTEVFYNIW